MSIEKIRREIKDRINHLENKVLELDSIEGLKTVRKNTGEKDMK